MFGIFLIVSCTASAQQNSDASPLAEWNRLAVRNSLVGTGKPPFHLKLRFQLKDISGKPQEEGTLEEWWTEKDGYRVEISAPSEHTVLPGPVELATDAAKREDFIVHQLLHLLVEPMVPLPPTTTKKVLTAERTQGQVKMLCYQTASSTTTVVDMSGRLTCVEPANSGVREILDRNKAAVRNRPATLAGTYVALAGSLAYGGVDAIDGQIETLQTFNPAAHPEVKLALPHPLQEQPKAQLTPAMEQAADRSDAGASEPVAIEAGSVGSAPTKVAPELIRGKVLHRVDPKYPEQARQERIVGTVMLGVTISEQGTINTCFPIASPSPLLTEAAKTAALQWTYEPTLLHGQPTKVNDVLTMNFNLRTSSSRF